jgi:hypothetical protein
LPLFEGILAPGEEEEDGKIGEEAEEELKEEEREGFDPRVDFTDVKREEEEEEVDFIPNAFDAALFKSLSIKSK